MISKFFIDRPVFASVLSIIIVLAGLVSMRVLPMRSIRRSYRRMS
jgi:multidrug efflux pump subunit AcrB